DTQHVRIHLDLSGRSCVVELLLDSCLSADGELEGLSEDFSALEVLSLCNTGLKSLSKLPSLPKLKRGWLIYRPIFVIFFTYWYRSDMGKYRPIYYFFL
uniref:Acidic leucine-rich nuclear phosphoprotein 32 family member n=1 Tax=Neogobius melanostomus TaxID=47308 RepID=A0A8C6UKR9_9GOBI